MGGSMLAAAKLSTKGQVVIPKPVRDALGLEAGDSMVFAVDGDRVIVRKLALSDVLREAEIAYREKRTLSVAEAFEGLE
jgi:AbrB family looped-hinge helix DNA binding protein